MNELFSALSRAIEGTPAIAVGASLLWGVLSVLLSPCHLSSIPLIVGFIDGQGRMSARRTFFVSLMFGVGILTMIGVIGWVTVGLGRLAGDVGKTGNYIVAGVFFLVGLHLMDVIVIPLPGKASVGMKRKGVLAAFVLGLVFGVALGPCTFAFMAPMLAVAFNTAGNDVWYGVLLLLMYGVGHCLILVLAGASTGWVQQYLNWNERSKGALVLKRICGALVIVGGLWMLYKSV